MQNNNPLVTVVCSCYSHSLYVEKSLDSVLNQSYKNIQLIIIDDLSTDNSVEVIDNWISKNNFGQFIKNKTNLGLTKSFNNAFKYIKGDFFIDLSADDLLLPDCIENQISVFKKFKTNTIGIVYGNAFVKDLEFNNSYLYYDVFSQSKTALKPSDGSIYKEIINHSNTICSVSSIINTQIFKELGGYDEELVYEDYDLWLRIARQYPIIYVDEILVERTKLQSSLGYTNYLRFNKKVYQFKYSTYRVLKKVFVLNKSKEEDLAAMDKIIFEIKGNIRILNLILIIKYMILWIRFKKNKHII